MEKGKHNRERIIEKLIKDGDSWAKTRRAYEMTLGLQFRAVSTMGNWLGGAFVYRDKKGDKNARLPIEVVPTQKQRYALNFVIEHTFKDESFGLTEELLRRMTVDKWLDDWHSALSYPTWPIHDRIMGIQASILSNLMYPTPLRRIYDNEFFLVPADEDALTLPELMDTITKAIWTEPDESTEGHLNAEYTNRKPMISSLQRNLQREHLELLIDLTKSESQSTTAYKPTANLVMAELYQIKDNIDNVIRANNNIDEYTKVHLKDAGIQIDKALEAQYAYKVFY